VAMEDLYWHASYHDQETLEVLQTDAVYTTISILRLMYTQ